MRTPYASTSPSWPRATRARVALAVASAIGIALATPPVGEIRGVTPAAAQAAAPTTPTTSAPSAAVGAWSAGVLRPLPREPNADFGELHPAGSRAVVVRVGFPWTGSKYPSAFAPIAADGTVGAVRRTAKDVVGGPAFDASGRGIVAVKLAGNGIGWATIDRAGVVGSAHRIGTAIFGAQVEMNANGDLVMAWIDRNTPRTDKETRGSRLRVRVAIRPAGGAFRRTETLPLSPTFGNREQVEPSFTIAIGSTGRLVVAAAELPAAAANRMVAWTGTTKTGFGPRRTVGRQASNTTVTAAITTKGGVVLAWSTQSQGEEVSSGLRVRAAALAPGAARFGAMKELDPGGPKELVAGGVEILPAPDGGALLVWDNARTGETYDVSAATVSTSGRFGVRRTMATDAAGVRAAVGPRGAAAVTWNEADNTARGIYRAPGQADFGAPESVPPGFDQLLFWPATGQLTLVALRGPATQGGEQSLEFATRSAD